MGGADKFDTKGLTTLEDLPATSDANRHKDVAADTSGGSNKNYASHARASIAHTSTKGKLTPWRVFHHLHRLAILGVALTYIIGLFASTVRTFELLHGVAFSPAPKPASPVKLMAVALGTTTLRESPLVKTMLSDDTSPRNGTIFLNASGFSHSPCNIPVAMGRIYSDAFMRTTYDALTTGASYNLTFLDPLSIELITPVVDCTSRIIVLGYNTVVNFFYLVRSRANPDVVSVMRIVMGNQDYRVPQQTGSGPAAVATITFVTDFRVASVKHHFAVSIGYPFERFNFRAATLLGMTEFGLWNVRLIPIPGRREIGKTIETATRSGFYIKAETEQSNVNTHVWVLPSDPRTAITTLQWHNKPGLRDSWAWVHLLQLLLGLSMISNIVIIALITFAKLRQQPQRELWIGDAFVAVYNHLHVNGVLVLCSWYMNEFWAILEFCLSDANRYTPIESITVFPVIIEADLRSIYLTVCGIIGVLARVRIDPLVGFVTFEIVYQNRHEILLWFPSLVADASAHAYASYTRGNATKNKYQQLVSPMLFWATSQVVPDGNLRFICTMLLPILLGLVGVVAFVIARRVYQHVYPPPIRVLHSRATATSGNEHALLELQRRLTLFELATGAELNNRFGFLAEYDNAVFIKGVKHASADGIYSNGFVIANGKFLLQTEDFWPIVLMKLLRVRYQSIYVYDITMTDGSATVKQTARLVYPQTLAWTDLLHLNITDLS